VLSTKVPLSRDDIAFLASIGVEEIQFSIDTLDPETATHQLRVMGPTYIWKMKQTIEACDELGLRFNVKSVVMKWNGTLDNFRTMYDKFSKLGMLNSWNVVPAFCSSFRKGYETYKPSQEALLAIKSYLENLHPHFIMYTSKLDEKTAPQRKFATVEGYARHNKTCAANTYSMGILSNGKATVCEMLYYNPRFYLGDIYQQSLAEIWSSKKALDLFNFKQSMENAESACYSCKVMDKCKKGMKKRFCLADVINSYGEKKWDYPDPRCPEGPKCDIEKIM
jgi:radical SAM protein with 4Fe4S-binding SPASM domain